MMNHKACRAGFIPAGFSAPVFPPAGIGHTETGQQKMPETTQNYYSFVNILHFPFPCAPQASQAGD